MAKIVSVVYNSLLFFCLVFGDDVYNVNKLMDESLVSFAKQILTTGDITVRLENITVGNYTLTKARLADITTLKRVGNSWMWNEWQTVLVNGSLNLGTMFLSDAQISGPQYIPDPLITVSKNSLSILIKVEVDTKASCYVSYELKWTSVEGVTLYSDNKLLDNIDITSWVKMNLDSMNSQFVPPITKYLEDHLNMCQSKILNELEMIKYNYDAERLHELN